MKFYEMELSSTPSILFALSVDLEKHKNQFAYKEDFLELFVAESGAMIYEHFDGTTDTVTPGMLSVISSLSGFNSHSSEGERQCHTTVGICAKYKIRAYDTNEDFAPVNLHEKATKNNIILLPDLLCLGNDYEKVLSRIKTISRLNLSPNPADKLKAIGNWYILAGMLTDITLKHLDNSNRDHAPSELFYVENAAKYINEHYKEKMVVADIAQHIGISEGYLHRIFKSIKGTSIISYINHLRISAAISLIKNRRLTLEEAAYNVGIEDPSYMSRLFKRIMGVSMREYLKKSPPWIGND